MPAEALVLGNPNRTETWPSIAANVSGHRERLWEAPGLGERAARISVGGADPGLKNVGSSARRSHLILRRTICSLRRRAFCVLRQTLARGRSDRPITVSGYTGDRGTISIAVGN